MAAKFFLWPEIRKWALKGDWAKVGLEMRLDREVFDLWIKTPNTRWPSVPRPTSLA